MRHKTPNQRFRNHIKANTYMQVYRHSVVNVNQQRLQSESIPSSGRKQSHHSNTQTQSLASKILHGINNPHQKVILNEDSMPQIHVAADNQTSTTENNYHDREEQVTLVENLLNNRSEQNNSPSVKNRSVSKKSVNLHEKSNFTLGQVSK